MLIGVSGVISERGRGWSVEASEEMGYETRLEVVRTQVGSGARPRAVW